MLRDNLAGLIEPMRAARELNPLALFTEQKKSSDDRPQDALKIPAPKGRNLTLTENAASPFHAEPRHFLASQLNSQSLVPAEPCSKSSLSGRDPELSLTMLMTWTTLPFINARSHILANKSQFW
jgi:hypothetical protein